MKPMLAATYKGEDIAFPVLCSPKLDGVRAIIVGGVVMSRTMKPIPNQYVQHLFGRAEFNGYDGELIIGDETDKHAYNKTVSGVMKIEGTPNVVFRTFDNYLVDSHFEYRLASLGETNHVLPVSHTFIYNMSELLKYETKRLQYGYEGVMIRKVDGHYKQGRSTNKEALLLKLKRFTDGEAMITGMVAYQTNANASELNELGYKHKSTKKAGRVEIEMLGALSVKDVNTGVSFEIGTGFTQDQRARMWTDKDQLLGRMVKYKHQLVGALDKPRFPVFLGFRSSIDM